MSHIQQEINWIGKLQLANILSPKSLLPEINSPSLKWQRDLITWKEIKHKNVIILETVFSKKRKRNTDEKVMHTLIEENPIRIQPHFYLFYSSYHSEIFTCINFRQSSTEKYLCWRPNQIKKRFKPTLFNPGSSYKNINII